jgi:hypothetical protein
MLRVDNRVCNWQGGPIRIEGDDGQNHPEGEEPRWLKPLLATKFFSSCRIHGVSHKCECNLFCLECTGSNGICSLCLPQHHVVQVCEHWNLQSSLSLSPAAPETSGLREKAVLFTDLLMCFLTKNCVCLWRRAVDSRFVIPRCDSSLRDSEGAGYHRHPDLYHQQRARGVSEWTAATQAS